MNGWQPGDALARMIRRWKLASDRRYERRLVRKYRWMFGEGPALPDDDKCHCGQPVVYGYDGDPTHPRGMCSLCGAVRCDVFPGACKRAMQLARHRRWHPGESGHVLLALACLLYALAFTALCYIGILVGQSLR